MYSIAITNACVVTCMLKHVLKFRRTAKRSVNHLLVNIFSGSPLIMDLPHKSLQAMGETESEVRCYALLCESGELEVAPPK